MDAPWTPIYILIMFVFHPFWNISLDCCGNFNFACSYHPKSTAEKLVKATTSTTRANISFQNNLKNSEVIYGMGMGSEIQGRTDLGYQDASIYRL